jgi:hypothetical protein
MNGFKRLVSTLLIASISMFGWPLSAQAGIVSTDDVISAETNSVNRDYVTNFLLRADVSNALQEKGISRDAALERVRGMTDSEITLLAGRIDNAPAGGEILGLVFTVFIVLLVTDILGLTKVFPFTRSVR